MPNLAPVGSLAIGGLPRNMDDASLLFHVDILICVFILFIILLKIPRAFALFGTSSEWYNGHFLRYAPYRPSARVLQAVRNIYPPPAISKDEGDSEDSHFPSHTHHARRLTEKGIALMMRFPPHVASCFKQLRPLVTPLRSRISPGFSVAQTLILVVYFYVLVYAGFYRSNIFTDSARTGWIAVAQMPFIFAFGQKNNALGSLLGYGYEKLNFLHRFAGRVVILSGNIHALHYFYKWSLEGTFKTNMQLAPRIWAMVALLCFDMIFVFATQFARGKAYNLFLCTHIVGFILVLPAVYYHKPSTLPWVISCAAIYAVDHLFRVLKTRIRTAHIQNVAELESTRIEIPSLNSGWRAGQHVRLRVLSLGMGWWGWTETHPFTIANVANGPEGLVLIVKKSGTWTRRLYDIAKISGYTDGGVGRQVKVMVEGPYGGPGHTLFSSFSSAVFVVGGSGISFALASIQDLIKKDLNGESRVKSIDLIWSVPDPQALIPLLPTLQAMIQQSVFTPIRVAVYYTRAPIGKFPFKPDEDFPSGLTLAPGRPRINKVVEGAIAKAVQLGAGCKDDEPITGLIVGVCGPVALADDVAVAVNSIEPLRRDQVGGIEIHEEVFGW